MKTKKALLSTLLTVGVLASGASQAAGWCESGKPVKFAGLNWESAMLLTDVLQVVLNKGYGCEVDSLPGNSITMENALSTNDIQIFLKSGWAAARSGTRPRPPAKSSAWARRSKAPWKAGTCRAT